jgi:hypothetical protein
LLTGSKEQYSIVKADSGKFRCRGKYNDAKAKWANFGNSPQDSDQTTWKMPWPKAGGGGDRDLELTKDELFQRLVEWRKVDYLVGAGTKGESDSNSTGGLVDNHAYAVLEVVTNAVGTGIDLAKVRNPWGRGEIEDGDFRDDGPG